MQTLQGKGCVQIVKILTALCTALCHQSMAELFLCGGLNLCKWSLILVLAERK